MSAGLVLGGRYELIARLAEGGFGSVWRARDTRMGREVAVKLLHVVGADIPRFDREAQSLARLNHPNIVTAHDFGVDGTTAYLVLELVRGSSLAEELSAPRPGGAAGLPLPEVLDVAAQVLDGLASAHAAGVIHRDLKPQNIMRTADRHTVKIVDFGIAHAVDMSRMTVTGSIIGTLPYMAPEQLDGGALDGRADLYSLGCVLHELLTGTSPFTATTPVSWMHAHQFQVPARVSDRIHDIPEGVNAFIDGMLAKAPGDRPADAATAREAVLRLRESLLAAPFVAEPVAAAPVAAQPVAAAPVVLAPVIAVPLVPAPPAAAAVIAVASPTVIEDIAAVAPPPRDQEVAGTAAGTVAGAPMQATIIRPEPTAEAESVPAATKIANRPVSQDTEAPLMAGDSGRRFRTRPRSGSDPASAAVAPYERRSLPRRHWWAVATAVLVLGGSITAYAVSGHSDQSGGDPSASATSFAGNLSFDATSVSCQYGSRGLTIVVKPTRSGRFPANSYVEVQWFVDTSDDQLAAAYGSAVQLDPTNVSRPLSTTLGAYEYGSSAAYTARVSLSVGNGPALPDTTPSDDTITVHVSMPGPSCTGSIG